MAIKVSLQAYSPRVNPDRAILKLTFTGSYPAGGDTLNLTPSTFADPNNQGVIGYPTTLPSIVPNVYSISFASAQAGYYAQVIAGTTLANFKLQILAAGGADLTATTYPAGILAGEVFVEMFV